MNKVGLIVGLVMMAFFAWYTFGYALPNYFQSTEDLEEAKIHDAKLRAYGCYVDPNNDEQFLCPNGLPPGMTE